MRQLIQHIYVYILIIPLFVFGQSYNKSNFFNYKNTTGLNYTQISDITQGSDGSMYFISLEGVTKYDGIGFTTRTSPYFSEGTNVTNLKLAPTGKIMGVFSEEFIFILDNWNRIKLAGEDAKDHELRAFEFIDTEHLWISTDKGVYFSRFYESQDSLEILYCLESSLTYKNINKLIKYERTGQIFGIDSKLGYFEISEDPEFVPIPLDFSEKDIEFHDVLRTEKFIFVLYNRKMMSVFTVKDYQKIITFNFGRNKYFSNVEAINDSVVWISSPYSGIIKFKVLDSNGKYSFRNYAEANGLTNNYVYKIFRDRDGIFWFGTNDGVSKLSSERFEQIDLGIDPGITGFPNCWYEKDGRIYSISDPYGVGEIIETPDGAKVIQVSQNNYFDKPVYDYHLDEKSNVLWLFSDKGIFYQYPAFSKVKVLRFLNQGFIQGSLWQSHSINDGQLLLGGDKYIYYVTVNGTKMKFINKVELPGGGKEVSAFYPFENKPNDVLIGGDQFLIRVQVNDSLKTIADLKHWFDNPDFSIYDIEKDSNGRWLFGTANEGLIIRENNSLYTFKNDSLIPYNTIYDIHPASDGSYWLGSYEGLSHISYSGQGNLQTKHYGFWEMIPPVDINFHSIHEAENGIIYYGLPNAIGIYYPNRDTLKQFSIPMNIANVGLQNKEISIAHISDLPYQFENLTLDFNLPVFFHEKQLQYYYQVSPMSEGWLNTLAPGKILISNLPSGSYELKLLIKDPGGVTKDSEVVIPMNVDSPIWVKWWFVLLTLIAMTSLLFFAWKIRISRLEFRQKELERIVDVRTQEISLKNSELEDKNVKLADLQKLKDEFLSIVAHDLKNPINAVVNLARMIQNDYEKLPNDLSEDAKVIESAATHMNNLVKNLLDFNRIEANQLVTHMQPLTVLTELERVVETYQLIAWPKDIIIEMEDDLEGGEMIFGDTDAFGQICGNIISNAIKFSSKNSTVKMKVFTNDGRIIMEISDNGPGIPDEIKDKIFEKFFTYAGEQNQNKTGNGLGLTIVKKLVELHKGEISLANKKKGNGATFTMKFDLYYEEEKSEVIT